MKTILEDINSHPDPDARARLMVVYEKLRGSMFENVTKVYEHLVKRGYDVGKSKVYGDAKKGVLKKQSDDTVFQVDVEEYILVANRGGPLKIKAESDKAEFNDFSLKNKEAEFKGNQLKNEKLEIDLQKLKGELVSRETAEQKLATNLLAYINRVLHLVRTQKHDWGVRSGADPQKLQEAVEEDLLEMNDQLAKKGVVSLELGTT